MFRKRNVLLIIRNTRKICLPNCLPLSTLHGHVKPCIHKHLVASAYPAYPKAEITLLQEYINRHVYIIHTQYLYLLRKYTYILIYYFYIDTQALIRIRGLQSVRVPNCYLPLHRHSIGTHRHMLCRRGQTSATRTQPGPTGLQIVAQVNQSKSQPRSDTSHRVSSSLQISSGSV